MTTWLIVCAGRNSYIFGDFRFYKTKVLFVRFYQSTKLLNKDMSPFWFGVFTKKYLKIQFSFHKMDMNFSK